MFTKTILPYVSDAIIDMVSTMDSEAFRLSKQTDQVFNIHRILNCKVDLYFCIIKSFVHCLFSYRTRFGWKTCLFALCQGLFSIFLFFAQCTSGICVTVVPTNWLICAVEANRYDTPSPYLLSEKWSWVNISSHAIYIWKRSIDHIHYDNHHYYCFYDRRSFTMRSQINIWEFYYKCAPCTRNDPQLNTCVGIMGIFARH